MRMTDIYGGKTHFANRVKETLCENRLLKSNYEQNSANDKWFSQKETKEDYGMYESAFYCKLFGSIKTFLKRLHLYCN